MCVEVCNRFVCRHRCRFVVAAEFAARLVFVLAEKHVILEYSHGIDLPGAARAGGLLGDGNCSCVTK